MQRTTLVHVYGGSPEFRWLEGKLPPRHANLRWLHFNGRPQNRLERLVRKPALARYRATALAGARARGDDVGALISHLPRVTAAAELTAQAMALGRRRPRHLAVSFNFTHRPRGAELSYFRAALRHVDTLLTFSTFEQRLYAELFRIPIERIEMVPFGADAPRVAPDAPAPVEGPYVAAIGGEARDYATLFQAAARLPDVRFVVIARPHNLEGLPRPANVEAMTNVPRAVAHATTQHAAALAVPLVDDETACGHITIVSGMHLGKPVVATASRGLDDYVQDGVTGLSVPPGDPVAMAEALRRVLDDAALAQTLGDAARRFARERCTEDAMITWFSGWLDRTP